MNEQENPPAAKLGIIDIGIFLGIGAVATIGAMMLLAFLFGPDRLAKAAPDAGGGDPMVMLALLAAFFGAGVPAVGLAVVRHRSRAPMLLGLDRTGGRWLWLTPIVVVILALIVDQVLLRLVQEIAGSEILPSASAVISEMATTAGRTALTVLVAGMLGPLVEELVFRGLVYGYVEGRFGKIAALVISSLLFAAAHVELIHVLVVLPIGLMLGWARMRSGSLWPSIAAHVANNSVAVISAYLLG